MTAAAACAHSRLSSTAAGTVHCTAACSQHWHASDCASFSRRTRIATHAAEHTEASPAATGAGAVADRNAMCSRRQLGMSAALALAAAGSKATAPGAAAAAARPPQPPKPFCGVSEIVPAWAYTVPWQEGVISFGGYKTWYRDVNNSANVGGVLGALQKRYTVVEGKLPVLVIPGGPGLSSSYLASLELMAGIGRRVVFYDPIGTGNSFVASGRTGPPASAITLQLLVAELRALCAALKLGTSATAGSSGSSNGSFHIYAQGTGGILALELAAAVGGAGIASLTLASTPPSYSSLIADRRACASALGGEAAQALLEQEGAVASGEGAVAGRDAAVEVVGRALREYRRRHVCRTPGEGEGCVAASRRARSRATFEALCGGRLFSEAGSLIGWDAKGAAAAVGQLPVLLSRGECDEVSAASQKELAGMLAGACPAVEFAGAGAYQHIDAWEPHLLCLEEFMSDVEGTTPATAAV